MLKSLQRKTWQDLKANRKGFLAVWLVIFLGTTFFGAMYPSGINLVHSIYNTYDQLAFMDFQIQLERGAPPGLVEQVQGLPGVAAAEGRLVVESGLQVDPDQANLLALRLISVPDSGEPQVNRSDVAVGAGIGAEDEVLLLKRFADYHAIRPGDELRVWVNGRPHTLRVAGLAFNPEYLVGGRSREAPFPAPSSFGVAWVRRAQLESMTGLSGASNDLVVRVEGQSGEAPAERLEAVRQGLEAALHDYPEAVVLGRVQTASGGVVDANVKANFPVLASFSALFMLGTLVTVSILMGRMVEGERQRIGTLRALGVHRGELVLHYLSFGLILGLTGGLAGSLAGYFNSFLTILPFVDKIAGGYLPGYVNAPQIPFILLGLLIVVGGVTLAAAYPAWVESGTPPGVALRPPTPKSPSGLSRLPLGALPLTLRQTVRNLLRTPGRSLSTAMGVMAGAVMVIASFVLIDSIRFSFEDYFQSNQYDLRVLLNGLTPVEAAQAEIEKIAGVEAVQGVLVGPVTTRTGGGAPFDTLAVVVDEGTPFFRLSSLEGVAALSRSDGVWIGHNLQRVLGVEVGDTITLRAGGEDKTAPVLGVVSQTFGSPVFVPRALMESWLPGGRFLVNAALVRAEAGQAAAVQEALAGVPGVVAVEDYASYVKDVNNYLDYWRQMSVVFCAFGWLLTLAVIANTINASLHERQAELAILRSLGVSAGEIARVVLLELLIMSLVGIAVGAPLGRAIGFQQVHGVDMDFYGLVTRLQPATVALVVASLLVVVLLAALPGLRAVQKIDLGQVSKSQSI